MSTAIETDLYSIDRHETLPAWRNGRRSVFGASDSAGLFGVGYKNQNAYSVIASKVRPEENSQDEVERFEVGHLVQPAIIELARRRIGIPIVDPGEFTIYRRRDIPWLGCTLDGAELHGDEIESTVEAKNVGQWNSADWDEDEVEPPLKYSVQAQHQMAVTGAKRCHVVGLIGGQRFAFKTLDRNDEFIAMLIERLKPFWGLVESNTLPEPDGSDGTTETLKRLYPKGGGADIFLPTEAADWASELAQAKEDKKLAEAREQKFKNFLIAAIGDADGGILPNGERFSYKLRIVKAHERKESRSRVLLKVK